MSEVTWSGDRYPTYNHASFGEAIPIDCSESRDVIVKRIEDRMFLANERMTIELDGIVNGWSRRSIAQKFRRLRERYYARDKA